MKLSKQSWIVIAIGVVLIVIGCLGRNYLLQAAEQRQLEDELSAAKQKLAAMPLDSLQSKKEQLETQFGQITARIKSGSTGLLVIKDSITLTDILIETARSCNVALTEIKSSPMLQENLAGLSVSSLPVDLKAEGTLPGLVSFATTLSYKFPSGLVKTIDMNVLPNESLPSANIRMVIYVYQENQK